MALTKSEARTSRLIFYAAAIVAVLYGLLFLSLPEWALQLSQDPGAPKDAGWLRWSGAFLIGIALAAWLAATQPDRQRALVVGLALSYLLVALSLLYSTISAQSSGYMSLESMKILRVLTDVWLPEFKFGPACVRATDMLGLARFCA